MMRGKACSFLSSRDRIITSAIDYYPQTASQMLSEKGELRKIRKAIGELIK